MGLLGRWLAVLVVGCWLAAGSAAAARTVLELDPERQPVRLLDWGDAWIDTTGDAVVEDVSTNPRVAWQPTVDGGIYRLQAGQALWIRFTVPPAPDAERWYLEVPYPSVNKATLYTPDSIGRWLPQAAGDTVPTGSWPVPHRHPLLPINVSAEEPRKYLLRVENSHSFSAPLVFISESHFARSEQRTSLVLGMYFGLAGLAVAVALLSAVSLRDRAYALYALAVGLMGLTQAAMTGLAGLHLWGAWPWWNDLAPIVLPVLGVGAVQWFFGVVVSLRARSRGIHALVMTLAAASVVVAAALMVVSPSWRVTLMVPYIAVCTTAGIAAVAWSARRGDRYASWVLAGSLPVALGAAFPLARTAGLIPVSFWTMHGMQIGIAIELPILLVMLMLRSQHRREHARRLQGLDRIDPETGLINATVFHERLVHLIARSQRLKLRSAVLLVELVNLDQMARDFGPEAADELPLRVAGRLLSAARDIDSVARLGVHTFGLLLEGPLRAEEVAQAAPRIVARCLMPFEKRPLEWTAQVRVAQALIPMDGNDATVLLEQLEALLAGVPADSKRAVFMLGKPVPAPAPLPAATAATS